MRPSSSDLLYAADVPALLLSNLTNIRYLTGVEVSTGFLLVQKKGYKLFVDSRYREMAEKHVLKTIQVCSLNTFKKHFTRIRQCGFEADTVTVSRLAQWKRKFKNTKFVQKRGVVEEFRRSKESDELRRIRKANTITTDILKIIPRALKEGITERDLAWKIRSCAQKRGADGMAFETIVAFGTHTSRPHHQPTDRKLFKGNLVQIDLGARYKGYCADQSAVFFTGKPTKKQQHVYDVLYQAKESAKKAVRCGVFVRELDEVACAILREYRLEEYFTHALGHGLGLDIHEGVTISANALNHKLLKNEVITIEPGVYFSGKWGMRLEETIIVK